MAFFTYPCGTDKNGLCVELRHPTNNPNDMRQAWELMHEVSDDEKTGICQGYKPSLETYQRKVQESCEWDKQYDAWIYVDGKFAGIVGAWEQYANMRPHKVKADKTCHICYMVLPKFRANGIGVVAVRGLTNFLFEQGYQLIYAEINVENQASLRTAEKIGFIKDSQMTDDSYGKTHTIWYGYLPHPDFTISYFIPSA